MTARHSQVLIIGAGVIGLSIAMRLAQAGLEVDVLDRGTPAQEASWAGAGILSPLHPWRYRPELLTLARASMGIYPAFIQELQALSGIDPEWILGGLWVLPTAEAPLPPAAVAWGEGWDWHWRLSDTPPHGVQWPNLGDTSALFCSEVAQVRNPRLLQALLAACHRLGVRLHAQEGAEQILPSLGDQGLRVLSPQRTWTAEQVIVTGGAWSRKILRDQPIYPDIQPVKGQMLLLEGTPGALPAVLLAGDHYLVQRRDGKLLVGSTSEWVGFDKTSTDVTRETLLHFAHRLFPASRQYPLLDHWSGLRPGSPDNIPRIGPVPGQPGLWVASGHFRYGLTLAPITAEILRAMLLQQPPPLDPAPYQLSVATGGLA